MSERKRRGEAKEKQGQERGSQGRKEVQIEKEDKMTEKRGGREGTGWDED